MRFEASEEDGVKTGLAMRPDVLGRLNEIEKTRVEHRLAKNSLLPEFDLVASYSVNGLAGDSGETKPLSYLW